MKQAKAHNFFSETEKKRIRLAVDEAEAHTSGEIATMIVDESDSYLEAETLGAILVSGLFAVIVAVAAQHITIWSFIPLVLIFFLPVRYIFRRYSDLKLPFAGKRRVAKAVRERALRAFFEQRLYKTKDETGILIFISLLERKIWILGDRGINSRISPHFWQHLTGEISRGLKENCACEALCNVIAGCGAELALHFPRKADDVNELTNEVIS